MPVAPRKWRAAAPVATRPCTRWSCTPKRSTTQARSTSSKASPASTDFYELPRNADKITLVREDWELPAELPMGDATVVPLRGGEVIGWKLKD
jgi:hypothetical protein